MAQLAALWRAGKPPEQLMQMLRTTAVQTKSKALSENNCPDWRRMFAQLQGGAEGASLTQSTWLAAK